MKPEIIFEEEPRRRYTLNGEVVPSVTQILGVLDKPALVWWGQGIATAGVLKLVREGRLIWVEDK